MASGLPDAISRREILAGNPKLAVDLKDLGRRYLQAGWLSDALDCFERSRDTAGLDEVKKRAIEGDTFLLTRLAKLEGYAVSPADWRQAAEKAERDGRERFGALGYERAGDAAAAEAAKAKVAAFRAELPRPTHGRRGLPLS